MRIPPGVPAIRLPRLDIRTLMVTVAIAAFGSWILFSVHERDLWKVLAGMVATYSAFILIVFVREMRRGAGN